MSGGEADAATAGRSRPVPQAPWWRAGPRSWIAQLAFSEIIAAVLVGVMFFVFSEVRENDRQDRAERLEDARQKASERLENLRFVRTASAEGPAYRRFGDLDLAGSQLSGLDLSRADLVRANLARANLSAANLAGALLSAADLRGANLAESTIVDGSLSGANLTEVDLRGTDLTNTNLSGATLTGSMYSPETKWPAGFDPSTTGTQLFELPPSGAANARDGGPSGR